MYLRRLIYGDVGKIVISIILGLGLATLFRKVCKVFFAEILQVFDIKILWSHYFDHLSRPIFIGEHTLKYFFLKRLSVFGKVFLRHLIS